MKKIMSIAAALLLLMTALTASSENGMVQLIINIPTTQSFSDELVSEDDLTQILQAGLSAASAINQQPWYFAVVSDSEMMTRLSGGGMPAGMTPPAGVDIPEEGASSGASSGAPAGGFTPPAASGGAKAGLGDSPVAIIIYMNEATSSPNASFDCGLACQNMVIAANALGYGTKIISSPTMTLNGAQHDELCDTLGVDRSLTAVAVLLLGKADVNADATSTASVRNTMEEKVSFVK